MTNAEGPRWVVTCSCGWEREASAEWAANAVARLHRQLADVAVEHTTEVGTPRDSPGGGQLRLT